MLRSREEGWGLLHIEMGVEGGGGKTGGVDEWKKIFWHLSASQPSCSPLLSLMKASLIFFPFSSPPFVLTLCLPLDILSYYRLKSLLIAHLPLLLPDPCRSLSAQSQVRGQQCNCLAPSPSAQSLSACQVTQDEGTVPQWVVKNRLWVSPALGCGSRWWARRGPRGRSAVNICQHAYSTLLNSC